MFQSRTFASDVFGSDNVRLQLLTCVGYGSVGMALCILKHDHIDIDHATMILQCTRYCMQIDPFGALRDRSDTAVLLLRA